MAAPAVNPYISYMQLQDPVAAMKFQQQQALAQQLLQGGDEQNPAQTVGSGVDTRVVPLNSLTGLANAGTKLAGALVQNKNNAKLATMMGGQPNIAAATNSAIGGGEGPATSASVGQQLGSQMKGPTAGLPTITGDPMKDWLLSQSNPELFKALAARSQPTDMQKNLSDPASASYVPAPMVETPSGVRVPQGNYMQAWGRQGGPQAAPSSVQTPPASPQAAPTGSPSSNAITALAGPDMLAPPAPGSQNLPSSAPPDVSPMPDTPPAGGTSGAPNINQLMDPTYTKQKEGLISGDQKYLNETLLPAKDGAIAANNNIGALQQAAAIANSSNITRTGPTDPQRVSFVKHLNDFLQGTGGEPIAQNEIANADAINKIGLRLTANMTRMMGSREAAQIFSKIQDANPSWYMQPQTLNLVSNLIKGENDTAIGRYQAGFQEAQKPGGLAQNGVSSYDANNPGKLNVKKAFAASGMPGFENPQDPDFSSLPSGSKFYDLNPQSPTYGKQLVKH